MKPVIAALLILLSVPAVAARASCDAGDAAGFACSHIDLVGTLSPAELGGTGEVLNDIWGWVDANGEEYALVGMRNGTAFVRITGTGDLVALGRLRASDGQAPVAKTAHAARHHKLCHDELCGDKNSAWRDIKVFGNHAYVVSEAAAHGLQIFDLTQLRPHTAPMPDHVWRQTAFYDGIGHAHNLFINEDTARAYVVGHDSQGVAGGLHVLDISTPATPRLLAELSADGYTHDVQCVVYSGPDGDYAGRELCLASNEDTLTIWDVEDVSDVTREDGARIVSRTQYADSGYTHQGWLSPDQRYFYLNDELDEMNSGGRTHLRVFDVSDIDAPELVADYLAPTFAIDHNNYAHGRWLYQSNYAAGLRILDVADPLHPVEAAYFDTQVADTAEFHGSWSNFVFPSGRVAVSDITDGLFIVEPTLVTQTTPPDLSVALVLDEDSAVTGTPVSGEFTLASAAAAAATDVLVTAHLPGGATFGDLTPATGWSCKSLSGGRVAQCRRATLEADSEEAFGFAVQSDVAGDIEMIVMAYANEADAAPADNLSSGVLKVTADAGDGGGAGPGAGSGGGGGGGGSSSLLLLMLVGLRLRSVRR